MIDQVKAVGTFHGHLIPAGVGVLVGLLFLLLMRKAERPMMKFVLFLVAIAFLAGSGWWFTHIRS